MNIADFVIRLSIFGVLAAAVIGTLQNVIAGLREPRAGKHENKS
jgi:hypothetical protein